MFAQGFREGVARLQLGDDLRQDSPAGASRLLWQQRFYATHERNPRADERGHLAREGGQEFYDGTFARHHQGSGVGDRGLGNKD